MIKWIGSLVCTGALVIHSLGTFYPELPAIQHDLYKKLVISCARNNYSNNIKKIQRTESPRDTKKKNPAPKNDQPGCVHSGTAAVVTDPQRFKRLNGKGNGCAH